jgi:hypothetical protein
VFNYFTLVKNFLDEDTVGVVHKYFDNKLCKNRWETVRKETEDYTLAPSHFSEYADPLIEIILEEKTAVVGKVVDRELTPTYSYSRIYTGDDLLTVHTDRPSCEYSVTVNIANSGEPWPIWLKAPEKEPVCFTLMPGDAVIYKGCEVKHWRNPMIQSGTNAIAQFMLHYVDLNGPFSEYKLDKRPRLGACKE